MCFKPRKNSSSKAFFIFQLEKQVSAMKSAVATLMSEKQKSQEELSKKTFEVSNTR